VAEDHKLGFHSNLQHAAWCMNECGRCVT
jgi:hypothetical protein